MRGKMDRGGGGVVEALFVVGRAEDKDVSCEGDSWAVVGVLGKLLYFSQSMR
jgi:hypothetical protein